MSSIKKVRKLRYSILVEKVKKLKNSKNGE